MKKLQKNTGLSTKTITRCIEKLHEDEGIQFTLIYDPKKLKILFLMRTLTWIDGDLKETLENLNNTFSESYLQIPFIAKNQIVLFLYSDSIFKMDELTQKVSTTKKCKISRFIYSKKISFYTNWIEKY